MPDYEIETSNRQTTVSLDIAPLEQAVRQTLACESVTSAEISLALVDSVTMRALNKQHLDHDYDTDVLSFLLESSTAPGGRRIDGEVIVSTGMAVAQAARFGWSVADELRLYLVHGTLHLCGYDDLTPELLKIMRERERTVLARLGLTPRYEAS